MEWSKAQESVLCGSGNMLVSASAGSGKTTVMVEKALRLIKSGTDIRRILLMTFTRAAAREMRDKLVKKMYEEVRGENGNVIREQLSNLPFAHIETIDGFCYSLMRKYFNVAGCDPGAAIGEDAAMTLALEESVDKAMTALIERGDADYLTAIEYFRKRRSYKPFKETVFSVIRFASSRPNRAEFYANAEKSNDARIEEYYLGHRGIAVKFLREELELFVEECRSENYHAYDAEYAGIRERLSAAAKAEKIKDFISVCSGITAPKKIDVRLVRKGIVSEELESKSGLLAERLRDFVKKVVSDGEVYGRTGTQQGMIKRAIVETCILAEKEYAAYKKRRNLVDIRDATDYALKVLADDKARAEIKSKFDYIFVDEYQDTNYLQEALVEGIGNGNVFSVGDVKQAIYHFRAAEPEIFLHKGERYDATDEGTNYFLNTNYRSCNEILDFTNRVCDKVMIKDFCGIDYKGTSGLCYGGREQSVIGAPAVSVYTWKEKKKTTTPPRGKVYSVKEAEVKEDADAESEFIASEVLSMVKNTSIKEGDSDRKVGFEDIAVLVRTGEKAKTVADTFERRGVPYYLLRETKGAFPERETLVDVMRAAFNAENDVPLFNAASSPVGNISDAEFTVIRADRFDKGRNISLWESLNAYNGDPKLEKKIKDFIGFLESIRLRSAFMTAEEVLREILSRNFDAFVRSRSSKTLAELNAFIAYVGGLGCNASCEDFLDYYDSCYKGNKPPIREHSVAIMTMHGSKGLEFPIVFLPYQDARCSSRSGHTEIDGDLGLAVRTFESEEKTVEDSFETRVIRMKGADEERQELARLMYVAFTRAKNRLVISGKECKPPLSVFDATSVMQWIIFAAEEDEGIAEKIGTLPEPTFDGEEKKAAEQKPFSGAGLKKKYAYEEDTFLPVKYSVSEVLRKQDGYGVNPFASDPTAMAAGTAVHTVMQYIDYSVDTLEGVKAAADGMVRDGYLTAEEREALDCGGILRTLRSELIAEAKRHTALREQPFIMYVCPEGKTDKVLVQGVIDLLIDEGDGYVVADFKTGRSDGRRLAEKYSKQLELYAEGVEKILKKPVKRKVIYSVTTGETVEL